jgi:hypothetical protein
LTGLGRGKAERNWLLTRSYGILKDVADGGKLQTEWRMVLDLKPVE